MPGTLKTYKARGIVLNSLKYGDSAMVVHLLTDALGRQSYMVQGVRSSRGRGSKLALFQPMFALEFEGLTSSRQKGAPANSTATPSVNAAGSRCTVFGRCRAESSCNECLST